MGITGIQGVFNRAVVMIYEEPQPVRLTERGMESAVVDEGLYGQSFTALGEREEGYIRIRTAYHYEGYVRSEEVLFLGQELSRKCLKPMWVLKAYADVLGAPKVSGYPLLSLTRGAVVMAEADRRGNTVEPVTVEGYVKLLLYDGREGYMKASYLAGYRPPFNEAPKLSCIPAGAVDEEEFRQAVVDTARSYLGTQYRWGGKSSLGIDCSGLTSMAYMLNGVLIYRDARLMPGFPVHEIGYADMGPGDLLYFPGHIAMYIGNNEYIHSTAKSGSDGVVINSLDPAAENFRSDLPEKLLAVGSIFPLKQIHNK